MQRQRRQHYLTVEGLNNNNETVKFAVATDSIMMVVMAFAPCMDEMDMTTEPYVMAAITLYMNSNLVASFDIKIPAVQQTHLEDYTTDFRTRDLNIRALGWVVSKVCVKSK